MKIALLTTTALLMLPAMAHARSDTPAAASPAVTEDAAEPATQDKAEPAAPAKALFSTGVAKGRDLLDSAISTSAIGAEDVQHLGGRSLGEIIRAIPGFRVEASGDSAQANYTIRGLPLAGFGSKFVQFQEDGLPAIEFGDLGGVAIDMLVRPDLNLSRIESIRGGSASTFASNSPGGVINFISKTGEVEGGSVLLTNGIGYDEKRVDMEYGARLSSNMRFHVGGYYRVGAGPRDPGYNAYKGGQVKLNLTREFNGGFIRFYAKLLDDRVPMFPAAPVSVSGTDANPSYGTFAGFDAQKSMPATRYVDRHLHLDPDGSLHNQRISEGAHIISKMVGFETRFEVAGWTVSDKFRYTANDGVYALSFPLLAAPAPMLAAAFGGPGATLSFASGPRAGEAITSPATLNGNGLASLSLGLVSDVNDFNSFVNDFRANRIWKIGAGDLTLTAGAYKSVQNVAYDQFLNTWLQDYNGRDSAFLDLRTATNVPLTQDGALAYSVFPPVGRFNRHFDVEYDITAPYGSLNYHIGRLAIGGSVRYDIGKVRGQLAGAELGGGRTGITTYDVNGDGQISIPETRVGVIPIATPGPVNYDYKYLSYSTGINFRIADSLAVFARYSRGARANADTLLFTPSVDPVTGKLAPGTKGYDPVRQTEMGVKYRKGDVTLNLTGFLANTGESNFQLVTDGNGLIVPMLISRTYRAYGAEFEGSYQHGIFSVTGSATYTHAEIKSDVGNPDYVGNTPRHQPKLIAQLMPQINLSKVSAGTSIIYTGSSYAQDINLLKMPAYTTVNAFVEVRPVRGVSLTVTASNLFNAFGIVDVGQGTIPADGIATATVINSRRVAASLGFSF
ncbi:TonB-dependent receptor domain-containing protein [Sphingomonas sp. RS6]